MSANTASSSKVESPAKVAEPHKEDDHPAALGVLEEDDEFEEFPTAGGWTSMVCGDASVLTLESAFFP